MIEKIIKLVNTFIYELYLTVGLIVTIMVILYLIGYFIIDIF